MCRSYLLLGLLVSAALCAGEDPDPVLLHETFTAVPAGTTLPAGWWSEGSAAATVKDGRTDRKFLSGHGEDSSAGRM